MKPMYSPEDRLIFEYPCFDSGKIEVRYADPLDLQFKLLILTQNRFDELVQMQKPRDTTTGNVDKPKWEDEIKSMSARKELASAMIQALGATPVTPTNPGMTMTHALKVLQEYLDFVETKKERAESLLRSQKSPSAQCSSPTMDAMSVTPLMLQEENSQGSTVRQSGSVLR